MKKIFILLISFLLGVVSTLVYLANIDTFNFVKSINLIENKTKPISVNDHKKFKDAFKLKMKNALINPIDWNDKLIGWPKELGGWVVDANLLEKVILKQGTDNRYSDVDNIYLELGYNDEEEYKGFTIMITGLQYISTDNDGNQKYKIINRTAVTSKPDEKSNILEYVNPCRPHCPE